MADIPWKDYLTTDDKTTTAADIDGDWEAQLPAKAAGAERESQDSGEEERDAIKYTTTKEALVQVNHTIDVCYHAEQRELIETCSKLQVEITAYRWLMAGQTTQQSIQDFLCLNVL